MSDLVKELMPYLEKLADKLDSSAQVLWQIQMAQAKIQIASSVSHLILITVMFYSVYMFVKYMTVKIKTDSYRDEMIERYRQQEGLFVLGSSVCLVIVAIGLIGAVNTVKTLLTVIFNPELWALQQIIEMVK